MKRSIAPMPKATVERAIALALEEDLGRGDVTTEACVPKSTPGAANFGARESLVLSGVPVIKEVYRQVDPTLRVDIIREDGDRLEPGEVAAKVSGSAYSILRGERVALNFAQRMSGVATQAARYVAALPEGSSTRVVDTRKTTPGLRAFERYAVRCGGAHNHREDLSSAVLIKDNHIAAAGGVREAVQAAIAFAPHTSRVECECDTLEQAMIALEAGADIIMLDNFNNERAAEAIPLLKGKVIVEMSGNITFERIRILAELGADVISSGALTHSAGSVDLGLDWVE